LQITSVGIMSILTGVMTLLQTFGTLPAGRWSSMIGPKALIQWITLGRALLTATLGVVFFFYTTGAIPSGLTLFLVTLITSADWFIRGTSSPHLPSYVYRSCMPTLVLIQFLLCGAS
jgi:hypothetical protein